MQKLHEPTESASTEISGRRSEASEYEQLEAAAAHLRKTERGRAALKNISQFFRDGGIGLDERNKMACVKLILAAFNNPWDLPANLTSRGGE